MKPIPLTWADFADGKTKEVVVEMSYRMDALDPVLTALLPARAYRSPDGYLIVEYIRFINLNPVMQREVYYEQNYPAMHLRSKLRYEVQLNLAVGNLVLWDKEADKSVRSNGMQWWDLRKDKQWFGWSFEDQDYTKVYLNGK